MQGLFGNLENKAKENGRVVLDLKYSVKVLFI